MGALCPAAAKLSAELRGSDLSGFIEDENSFFPVNALFYERPSEKARAERYAALFIRLLATVMVLHGFEGDLGRPATCRGLYGLAQAVGRGRAAG